jgi:hypothetical protein
VDGLASILGCGFSSFPFKYLDLPLRASYKANLFGTMLLKR